MLAERFVDVEGETMVDNDTDDQGSKTRSRPAMPSDERGRTRRLTVLGRGVGNGYGPRGRSLPYEAMDRSSER